MTNKIIQQLEAEQMSKEIPPFAPGDTVIVQVKVKEGDRQRLQAFEGVVIGKRNRGLNSAFETGANDVLVVKPCEGSLDERERLLPYTDQCVLGIDLEQGEMRVDWDADF